MTLPVITPADALTELCRREFAFFVQTFWPVVEPNRPLMPSVAVDAICAVLQEAGERGGRWAISCPPGVGKSLLASVLFPAWLLLRSRGRVRLMSGSYSWDFASRDAWRGRDLRGVPGCALVVGAEDAAGVVAREQRGSGSGEGKRGDRTDLVPGAALEGVKAFGVEAGEDCAARGGESEDLGLGW